MRILALLFLLASCGKPASSIPSVRFANAPIATAVNDRRNIKQPAEREFVRSLYHYDGAIHRRLTKVMELERDQRAIGINALDNVPDSTWFTNRIGKRDVSPDEIRAAPGGVGSPEPHLPWTIQSTKAGGMSIGFIIKDARGKKFVLKFDARGYAETETATHVIVGKLLWAFGYNVTEDYVVFFREQDLVLGKDAVVKDLYGGKRPLLQAELARLLARVQREPDGRMRGLASHWLDGKPIGGHPGEGVRADDPNDRIPHELRRDLRGAYPLLSWLDHNDIQEGNFADSWVEDPKVKGHHYVKHYWLDFGKSLGYLAEEQHDPRRSHEYYLDWAAITRSLLTLGLVARTWEDRPRPGLRGVGLYDVYSYYPGRWKPSTQVYEPLRAADRIDKFWGAKILIRFTAAQIRAAVEAGRLSDPRSTEYLVKTMIARQRMTAKYWFERVNPLDEFEVRGDALCFADLSLVHAFAKARTSRYTMSYYDRRARTLGNQIEISAAPNGRTCGKLSLASGGDGYTIIRIDTTRPNFTGTTYVHVARDPDRGTPRVVGIWRP